MDPGDGAVIHLNEISKAYRIPVKGRESFSGSLTFVWDALLGRYGVRHRMFRSFQALSPLSLRVGRGEAVAIVGRNGCGKSTLLQIIAGTLKASGGTVRVTGRLSALLELGSGFNPDFTGRENIQLNAAMLGLSRERISEKLEEILRFADIGEFVDQPVRTYSSGMRLRLAFAVITAVDPEILIIDEALSVGDAFFQSKCVRWLEDFIERDKTFLCVSHDMFMVQRLCQRGIVLDRGKVVCDTDVAEAANMYYQLHSKKPLLPRKPGDNGGGAGKGSRRGSGGEADRPASDPLVPVALELGQRTGDRRLSIESLKTLPDISKGLSVGDWLTVEIDICANEPVEGFHVGFGFNDRSGQLIGGLHTFYTGEAYSLKEAGDCLVLRFEVKLDLKPQLYLLLVGAAINHTPDNWYDLDCLWNCAKLALSGPEPFWGLTSLPVRNRQTTTRKQESPSHHGA